MSAWILVLDAGTTGVQVSFFHAHTFAMKANHKVEFPQIYPSPGLVEHDPSAIWKAATEALEKALETMSVQEPSFQPQHIVCMGMTNQRETCLAWNRVTGEHAGNALVWQDRRTADFCAALAPAEKTWLREKTGLVCDPYFSASKMRWLSDHHPVVGTWAAAGSLALGTIDAYLLWRLTGGQSFYTDHTNACRTMLYNLESGQYDPELADFFRLPLAALPAILPSAGVFGHTRGLPGLPDGIPITGVIGDQQGALLGQRCTAHGDSKITLGTGAFLLMHTGEQPSFSQEGLLSTVAFSTAQGRTFALEGAAFIAGAAVQFVRDNLGWVKAASETGALASQAPRDEHVLFIPALAGLAAPHWNPQAKGVLWGLSRGTKRSQIVRAVLESIAFQNVQLLRLMEQACGTALTRVSVDGGVTRGEVLMQFQSDVLQTPIYRPANQETTSLGAAYAAYAGLQGDVGDMHSFMAQVRPPAEESCFHPQMSSAIAEVYYQRWQKALEAVNGFYS